MNLVVYRYQPEGETVGHFEPNKDKDGLFCGPFML